MSWDNSIADHGWSITDHDFLADEGRKLPGFRLLMQSDVESLIERDGVVAGLRARTPDGPLEIAADLVIGGILLRRRDA